ncbi:MAG: chitooligosaccharide deacetylase [Bacteroidetes bacterium]|nr:MAG: chitooligosaccharide deacetylase [Bacteroidota bacterium]
MKLLLFLIVSLIPAITFSQDAKVWNNKKCAVVLTYDDALDVHLDNVIPLLDSLGLKATFYLIASAPASKNRLNDWKKAAAEGHELGNHTLFHPCVGNLPGREWVSPDYNLSKYTVRRMIDEARMTNVFLQALDGKTKRTYAFPCGDTKIGDTLYFDSLKNDFEAARSVAMGMTTIDKIDLSNTGCFVMYGQTGDQMINIVKRAMQTNSVVVFLFHGVGGGHNINVSLDAHRQLIDFLKQNEKEIWVAPMVDVAEYVKAYRKGAK